MDERLVNSDCRFYVGDRPCKPHKEHGVICSDCSFYDPILNRILIVKLGAAGDVLRTTALLPAIREQYSNAHITWICGSGSFALVEHNPLIDRPLMMVEESLLLIKQERFDIVFNFDLDPSATALASVVDATERFGYGRKANGAVYAFTPAAEEWLQMSLWDDFKKQNTRTYQSHMYQVAHLPDSDHPVMTPLLPAYQVVADQFAQENELHLSKKVIGLNVGAGHRWQHKKWTVEGFASLAKRLYEEEHCTILILYGPEDALRAREVMDALVVPYIDGQARANVLEFFAILNLCDVVVTGDTLALHAALGLGKKVICLVGPTSASELEMYDHGIILQGDIDCLGCYLTRCDKDPYCMKLLESNNVFDAVKDYLV